MGYVVSTLSLNCGATICLAIPINASEFKYVHFHVKKGWVWGMKNKLCFIGRHYIIFDQHYYEYDNTDGKDMGNDFVWDTVNMHLVSAIYWLELPKQKSTNSYIYMQVMIRQAHNFQICCQRGSHCSLN